MSEKTSYYDAEIEHAIIGYLIVLIDKLEDENGISAESALSMVKDEHFYFEHYKKIFIAIRSGVADGLALVKDMVKKYDAACDYESFIKYENLCLDYKEYVASLIRMWQLRNIISLFNAANIEMKKTFQASDAFIKAHETYEKLKEIISIIEDVNGVDVLAGKVYDDAMNAKGETRIIKSFIQKLDANIHFRKGSLYLLAGKAKSGKTTLALNIIRAFCKTVKINGWNERIVYVTLEMSREDLMRKLISIESGVPELAIFSGALKSDMPKILKASEEISTWNLDIIEGIGLKVSEIYAKIIPIRERSKLAFVFVDHYTALTIDGYFKSEIDLNEKKAAQLANMVKFLNLCMILIAHQKKTAQQYNKKEDEYDEPTEGDISGYGALEKWISGQIVVFRKKDRRYENIFYLYFFWWRYCKPLNDVIELNSDMNTGYIGD